MVTKKTWNEFRDCGLLWFTNRILHLFGWAICMEYDDFKKGTFKDVYPVRCKFRGFAEKVESEGFIKVSEYLKNNIEELVDEAKE